MRLDHGIDLAAIDEARGVVRRMGAAAAGAADKVKALRGPGRPARRQLINLAVKVGGILKAHGVEIPGHRERGALVTILRMVLGAILAAVPDLRPARKTDPADDPFDIPSLLTAAIDGQMTPPPLSTL
jgi:hypothetical protein